MSNVGPKFTVNAAFFQEIKEDHQQLKHVLGKLAKLTSLGPAINNHGNKLTSLLAELRDQLAFHFALEEAYGYFEDAIERAPRFHEQAGKLRSQHAELYLMSQEIADQAGAELTLESSDFVSIGEKFDHFNTALAAHESAELRLILDAISLDVGEGD
ncbi:MAG: hemerythrin domain-containing protein [Planctomycetales bacterium]|nr:hemerythrin domain-containing protein [Planctomycetales bacterium]